ncbi:MAG: hypothetical protein FWC20_02930, partial [Oscillospiraceae bacterium]|nr:hypothetical protein [Oscillospiraceae bacterium]
SDNVITKKSLVSGRSNEEMEYREFTRREIFPEIILSVFNKKIEAFVLEATPRFELGNGGFANIGLIGE